MKSKGKPKTKMVPRGGISHTLPPSKLKPPPSHKTKPSA